MLSANQSFQNNILSTQKIVGDSNQPSLNQIQEQVGSSVQLPSTKKIPSQSQNDIDSQVLQNPQSLVYAYEIQKVPFYKQKKFFIICGVTLAVLLIVAGVIGFVIANAVADKPSNSPTIPKTYSKYEAQIMAGQENNFIKIINVPKALRVYNYKLSNVQKTSQSSEIESETISTVQHKLGLVCINVTDISFDMMLYVMESSFFESNSNNNSTLSGYPQIKNNKPTRRFLNDQQESPEINFDDAFKSVHNQFGTLTEAEVNILASKNITENDYYLSNLPIIRFTMTKNGLITSLSQPVNLRYDLHSVFLNILEQIAPVVTKDFYSVVSKDQNGGKRRILSAPRQYTQRMLNNQEINPIMEAEVESDIKGTLGKVYSKVDTKSNQATESVGYSQQSILTNGALQTSNVLSNFEMQDNSVSEESSIPLMKKLGMNSTCTISFLYQEDEMKQNQLEELIQDQEDMSVLELTWFEAIDLYNKVFNKSTQSNLSKEVDLSENRHLEQTGKVMGKTITKPIFRQNYASLDFGADIQSQCYEGSLVSSEDICTVGLYSYFNGESIKIAEKQAKVNISKILKYYQYIQNILNDKLVAVNSKVQNHIETINKNLGDIVLKAEQLIDVQQNPIIKEIYSIVYNDELKIISQIQYIELFINTAIKNVNLIAEDPFTTLKTRTLNFLAKKQVDIKEQVENIEKFYKTQFKRIINFIATAKTSGVSEKVYAKLKAALEHYDSVIIELIEIPVKKMLDQLEAAILEQAEKTYKNAVEIDTQVSAESSKKNATEAATPNKIKQILTTVGITENLQTIVTTTVKQILNQGFVLDALKTGLKQTLDLGKQEVLKQLDGLKKNNTPEANKIVDEIVEDMENVVQYSINLYHDIKEVKDDIVEIVNALKKLQGQDMKKLILGLASSLVDFPMDMVVQIKDSAVATVQRLKQIGVNMKNNLIQWKDELVNNTKTLLEEVKLIYKDVIDFLQIKTYPTDDPKFYAQPLYNDITQLTQGVKDIMKIKFTSFVDTYNRVKALPTKFKTFITDMKALGQRTIAYYGEIKVAVTSMKIDGGLIWQYIQKRIKGEKTTASTNIDNTVTTDIATQVEQQAITPLNDSVGKVVQTDMATYQQQVETQQVTLTTIYKNVIKTIISSAEFQKTFTFEPFQFPLEYIFLYPTPIGVAIKLKIYAKWNTGFNLNFNYKNAILDLSAGATTKVIVGGEVSASIVIAEVGGYAEGTFLETSLTVGLQLQVLNKFKGNFYIEGNFKPYSVKIGIYYLHYFPTEIIKCGGVPTPTKDEVTGQIEVKQNVQAVNQSILSSIFGKIKKAIECLTTIKIVPKRNDIFPPFEVTGQTYTKRLFEESF